MGIFNFLNNIESGLTIAKLEKEATFWLDLAEKGIASNKSPEPRRNNKKDKWVNAFDLMDEKIKNVLPKYDLLKRKYKDKTKSLSLTINNNIFLDLKPERKEIYYFSCLILWNLI